MKKAYEKLYEDCKVRESFYNDAHFVSMQGVHYQENTRKFMLIGRATNGWGSLNTGSAALFGEEAELQFNDRERWNWIESVNGTLYSTHDRDEKDLKKRYCIDNKPYWDYTKAIWKQLPGTVQEDEIWQKNIVWSNLYKVSPKHSDNPGWESKQIQQAACIEVLKREIEIYQPAHVLIITGFDWFAPFSEIFSDVCDLGVRNVAHGPNRNSVYVEGTAKYGDAKVVVACRPEKRNKQEYINAILKMFGCI